jgi:hypothetical protein
MSVEEIIRLIFSFLGGGLVAGLLDWWRAARSERRSRRIEFVRLQLQELYGPLQFFASCNAELFELIDKLLKAYNQEYVKRQWSRDQATQYQVRQAVSQTIDIANQYIEQVKENNEHILTILKNRYSLIEPTDVEVFRQFIVDYTRLKTEIEGGRLKTPFEIYQHLGSISFMRPEFIKAVDKRFNEKRAELDKLLDSGNAICRCASAVIRQFISLWLKSE